MEWIKEGPFRVSILAADSMGVRSLATLVDACGTLVGLDLGASLAPRRYGLPPHQLELQALEEAMNVIRDSIAQSQAITITHYHYDHFVRDEPELYRGKVLLIKDPANNINWSQRGRARRLLEVNKVREMADVRVADGNVYEVNGVRFEFSPAVWHGEPGTPVGRLVMVRVSCNDESIVFASDVQGPADPEALRQLIAWGNARLLMLSGPPTYFAGFKVPVEAVQSGLNGLLQLVRARAADTIVVDHHLLRDLNYRSHLEAHMREASVSGIRLVSAAEYMGRETRQLEAMRRQLWGKEGKEEREFEEE